MTISKETLFTKIKDNLVKTLNLDPELITLDTNIVEDLDTDSISLMRRFN